jgi:hypothetical protein
MDEAGTGAGTEAGTGTGTGAAAGGAPSYAAASVLGGQGPGGSGIRGKARFAAMLRAATIAATVAMPVNIGIYLAAQAGGADFRVSSAGTSVVRHVGLGPVVSETLVAILFGSLLLWPMTYLRGGRIVWLVMAAVVGVGSTLIPLTRGLDTPTKLALASMHLVALAAVLAFPARTAKAIGSE